MKNLLMAFALVLSVPAFANEEAADAMSFEEMAAEDFQMDAAIADSADLALRPGRPGEGSDRPGHGDRPGNGDRPGHGNPGHNPGNGPGHGGPGWGNGPGHGNPGHGPGFDRRRVQCVATNARGQRFFGLARNQNQASREAIGQCYNRSNFLLRRTCRVRNCQVVWNR